jgi:hypothetical protein
VCVYDIIYMYMYTYTHKYTLFIYTHIPISVVYNLSSGVFFLYYKI